jgi:hypothetical protein
MQGQLLEKVVRKKQHKQSAKDKYNQLKEKSCDKILKLALDYFSESDLASWRRFGQDLESYNLGVYYCLEQQRASKYEDLKSSLMLQGVEVDVTGWVRIVDYQYTLKPLSAVGSILDVGQRFNIGKRVNPIQFPPFHALYIAEDELTARQEKFPAGIKNSDFTPEEFALRTEKSITTVFLKGKVINAFDLTTQSNLKEFLKVISSFEISKNLDTKAKDLGIPKLEPINKLKLLFDSVMELNWRIHPNAFGTPSNSQIIAKYIREAGFEGILYNSVRGKGKCLAIFPENFEKSSSCIEVKDKSPDQALVKLDSSNWKEIIK